LAADQLLVPNEIVRQALIVGNGQHGGPYILRCYTDSECLTAISFSDVDDVGIALITVNAPAKLNALSGEVVGELDDAFGRVANDSAIQAAIVTGAGEKAFVAGGGHR